MSRPTVEEILGRYRFYWNEEQVCLSMSRLKDDRDGATRGEVLIESTAPGVPKHLHGPVGINLTSTRSREDIIKKLSSRYGQVNWNTLIEQACVITLDRLRIGEPIEELSTDAEIAAPEYLLAPLMPKNKPTIFFGLGGTFKSSLALVCALAIQLPWKTNPLGLVPPNEGVRVLYLDWETDRDDVAWNLRRLQMGMGLPHSKLLYRRCALPIADDLGAVQETIVEKGVSCVMIDSAAAACGGDISKPEPVLRFFNAVRRLKTTSLILAHTSKGEGSDDNGPKRKTPFGSAFFENYCRSMWEVRKVQEAGDDDIELGLFHSKVNMGKQHRAVGLHVTFTDKTITVTKKDVADIVDLATSLSLGVRIHNALVRGERKNADQLAVDLGAKKNSLTTELYRLAKKGVVYNFTDGWGLLERRSN